MKTAVVLFNLGGPDSPAAVQPFLFNLFNDPAIIAAPRIIRWCLAKFISKRRAPVAREIYEHLGGRSPLLANTQAQARALEKRLNDDDSDDDFKVFIAMRYWHPFALESALAVKAWEADRVILLPLYPQYSTTTTGSSLKDWHSAAAKVGLEVPASALCCYPTQAGFAKAVAKKLGDTIAKLSETRNARVLFSAHGLPKKIVSGGDPYQWQVEQSVKCVIEALGDDTLDWVICYQSRVGPLEWIGPATEEEIERAARDGRDIIMVPIAFVSEHSETLVELDIEYRKLAEEKGVLAYHRIGTVDDDPIFIDALAQLVTDAMNRPETLCSGGGKRICPQSWSRCALADSRVGDT